MFFVVYNISLCPCYSVVILFVNIINLNSHLRKSITSIIIKYSNIAKLMFPLINRIMYDAIWFVV